MSVESELEALITRIVQRELAKLQPANDGEHLTVAAFARKLSISERTVRDAIREGRLEHQRIGRAVRIPSGATIAPRAVAAADRARLRLLGR